MRYGLRQVGARLPAHGSQPVHKASPSSNTTPHHRGRRTTPAQSQTNEAKLYLRPDEDTSPNPFRQLHRVLRRHESKVVIPTLSERLDVIGQEAFSPEHRVAWPRYALIGTLTGPTDQASLIRLLPVILRNIDSKPIGLAAEIAQRMLSRVRVTRILPMVPTIMDHLLARLGRAAEAGEADRDEIMVFVDRTLVLLESFRSFSNITPWSHSSRVSDHLPPTIDDQVLRLAAFAIDIAESSPSSSSSPSLISRKVRRRLFTRIFWTPELMRLLLSHIPRKQMSSNEWRACTHGVVDVGGSGSAERAESFVGMAREVEERLAWGEDAEPQEGPEGSVVSAQKAVMAAADQITLARCGATAQLVIQSLEPYLDVQPDASDEPEELDRKGAYLRSYAWSTLMVRLSSSPHTTADDLLNMAQGLAEDLTIPHIMTPIVTGLVARGDLEQAWAMFQDLAEKQKEPDVPPRRYVDRQLLAAVTPLCAQLYGASAAVQLVDDWARRPSTQPNSGWQQSIIIDPHNLNALLTQYTHSARPSISLRLMAAALPRWGLWPDHVSLKLLLDCCRFSPTTKADEPDTIRSRLRDLVGEIHLFPHTEPSPTYSPFNTARLGEGDHNVLLDPEGATWRGMMGEMRPWQYARRIFRDVILGNWPHLANIHSPLEFGPFARLEHILLPYDPPQPGEIRHPLPTAQYTHLIPVPATFQSYITLLGYYNLVEEIPTALSWARELGIEPNWKTMCSALAYIGEVEGPRRRVRGWYDDGGSAFVRDEEIMRRWLEEWVQGDVPTESDVARFVKSTRDKGGRMSAGRWGKDQ